MIDLVNPDLFFSSERGISKLVAFIPGELRPPVIGLTLFSLVYLLGSMVTPVASEFLNDPDMLGGLLPTEEKIQTWAYSQMGAPPIPGLPIPAKIEAAHHRDSKADSTKLDKDEGFRKALHRQFQYEEGALLLKGTDGTDRLNRLHEQLKVIRGATFSAFALTVLCLFAWCGRSSKNQNAMGGEPFPWHQVGRWVVCALSLALILVVRKQLLADIHAPEAGDIPIAELVLLVLASFGMYVAIRGTRSRLQFHGVTFLFALFFTVLCYAGYGCTETSYDQAVFSSYQTLIPAAGGDSVHAVARPMIASSINE